MASNILLPLAANLLMSYSDSTARSINLTVPECENNSNCAAASFNLLIALTSTPVPVIVVGR